MRRSFRRKFAAISILILLWAKTVSSEEIWDISAPWFLLGKEDRIIGFQVKLTKGRIVSLADIPILWSINVDNGPASGATLQAGIMVGAAAFDKGDQSYFKDFILIQKMKPLHIAGEPIFDIKLEIDVTKDFEVIRRIHLEKTDLILKKWPGGASNKCSTRVEGNNEVHCAE